ncbi:hypothetical protein Tco_0488937 [Tanacetum coccineum]
MERKIDEWEKSRNISLEQTDRTEPPPPPQAQTKQVNAVFTGSGKSDDPPKILKDPPPPIIVNNKTKKDKPIKTSKKSYHVVCAMEEYKRIHKELELKSTLEDIRSSNGTKPKLQKICSVWDSQVVSEPVRNSETQPEWTVSALMIYNNTLKVFENDVKGSTASSSSTQNVAFVSENTISTNDVSTAYGVANPSGHNL